MISAWPVSVFWMHDEHGPDAKILAVPTHDPRYADLRDLPDIPAHLVGSHVA
jgi:inorganic pyrophosphatase